MLGEIAEVVSPDFRRKVQTASGTVGVARYGF
jgi:hypothetical protein